VNVVRTGVSQAWTASVKPDVSDAAAPPWPVHVSVQLIDTTVVLIGKLRTPVEAVK